MLELFIISLCIGDYACSDAIKAYSKTQNGSRYINNAKKMAYEHVNKDAFVTIGTFVAAASNKKVKIKLTKNLIIEGNKDEMGIGFRYDF